MPETRTLTGKLLVQGKELKIVWTKPNSTTTKPAPIPTTQLHPDLAAVAKADLESLHDREVVLELDQGAVRRVRPPGAQWDAPKSASSSPPGPPSSDPRPERPRDASRVSHTQQDGPKYPDGEFFNPYNFIPAPNRVGVTGPLGDAPATSHDRYHEGLWSGRITVGLTTETPLLIPDAARMSDELQGTKHHKTYPVRVGLNGTPYLSPTSIKGMLRAAYEAVTNSRLAIFAGHDTPLKFRDYPAPRRSFPRTPQDLLPLSLRPATGPAQLSPADRVFGWVNPDGPGAHRGHLRIGPVTCEQGAAAIEDLGLVGLPLAILGEPKPTQGRFYVAEDDSGRAQPWGETAHRGKEQSGYVAGRGLRGRKVYPHHRENGHGFWDPRGDPNPTGLKIGGRFREYLRPDGWRDDQNRSVRGWIKPKTTFRFDIHVLNLCDVELGALLWVLSLPKEHFHRLGGGKPLGFGSVRVECVETELETGDGWRAGYQRFDAEQSPRDAHECVQKFKSAVEAAYRGPFDQVSFVSAFCHAARGFAAGKPVHYPRLDPPMAPMNQSFKWFARNGSGSGLKLPLRDLVEDDGLPYKPTRPGK